MADETKQNEGGEPTLAEVKALAEAASQTAMEAKTAAEARPQVEQAVKDEARKEGVDLSDEDAKKIANALVTQLDAMGVFEDKEEENNPPTPAATAADTSAQNPNDAQQSAPVPPAPDSPSTDSAPKKRTFAERFMGR